MAGLFPRNVCKLAGKRLLVMGVVAEGDAGVESVYASKCGCARADGEASRMAASAVATTSAPGVCALTGGEVLVRGFSGLDRDVTCGAHMTVTPLAFGRRP